MHKSWGNAIDFDDAAERMGVDVMRWLFAKARPEENIAFGWHAGDAAHAACACRHVAARASRPVGRSGAGGVTRRGLVTTLSGCARERKRGMQ